MKPVAQRPVGIALIGTGVVGGGAAAILLHDHERLQKTSGCELQLRHVVARNPAKAKAAGIPANLIHESLEVALQDPQVDILIELIGGIDEAKTVISRALHAGKHVVTANKALLAHHGPELFALARSKGVCLAFEASCAGGVPIIRALYDGLLANEITALYGIVNGTCNYILTEMIEKGKGYAAALKDAQAAGFAEGDPTLDVKGIDASHKIGLLAGLAFGQWIDPETIETQGIDELDEADVQAAIRLGYGLKLLAQARRASQGIFVRVEPAFIAKNHPLAWVGGSFNAVSVYGKAVGHSLYYGRGAGANPTASAVIADLLSIASGSYPTLFRNLTIWPDLSPRAEVRPSEQEERRFYLRVTVQDSPGTLAAITRILGEKAISVASIHQEEVPEDGGLARVPVIIIVHTCREGLMRQAVAAITALPGVEKKASLLPILDEHPEFS